MCTENITIVAFGDSITEAIIGIPDEMKRWPEILKHKLAKEFPSFCMNLINSGKGGNSTREAMARFEEEVISQEPDIVLLEFGGNNGDIANPERIVTTEEFKMFLNEYKAGISEKTSTVIITFPPVLDELHFYSKNPEYAEYYKKLGGIDKSVEEYRKIVRDFARENNYPVFDLYKEILNLSNKNGKMTYTLPDGVHLTEAANIVLANGIFKILKNIIGKYFI